METAARVSQTGQVSPLELVAGIRQSVEDYWKNNPEDNLAYWMRKIAGVRGNGINPAEADQTLRLSGQDVMGEARQVISGYRRQRIGCIYRRLQNAQFVATMINRGRSIDPDNDFLIPFVTTKEGFFGFTNSVLYAALKPTRRDRRVIRVSGLTAAVNQACQELYLKEPDYIRHLECIRDAFVAEVFPQFDMIIRNHE